MEHQIHMLFSVLLRSFHQKVKVHFQCVVLLRRLCWEIDWMRNGRIPKYRHFAFRKNFRQLVSTSAFINCLDHAELCRCLARKIPRLGVVGQRPTKPWWPHRWEFFEPHVIWFCSLLGQAVLDLTPVIECYENDGSESESLQHTVGRFHHFELPVILDGRTCGKISGKIQLLGEKVNISQLASLRRSDLHRIKIIPCCFWMDCHLYLDKYRDFWQNCFCYIHIFRNLFEYLTFSTSTFLVWIQIRLNMFDSLDLCFWFLNKKFPNMYEVEYH